MSEGRYCLHTCVHDWTLEYLNHEVDQEKCSIDIHCVAGNVTWESEADYWVRNRRVLPHVNIRSIDSRPRLTGVKLIPETHIGLQVYTGRTT
jgi:hypothetical protein